MRKSDDSTTKALICTSTVLLVMTGVMGASAEQVVVTYEVSSAPDRLPVMQKWAEAFMKAHPGIKAEPVPQQSAEKNFVAIQGGTGADLIIVDWNILASYAGNQMAVPLDSYIQQDRLDLRQFYPMPLDGYKFDGRYYALPLKVDTHVMAYNRDLFDQAAVAYPIEWIWDELRQNARKLTRDSNGDGQPEQYGFGLYSFYFDAYIGWIWQNGGEVYQRVGNRVRCTYDDPRTVEAIQYLADLMYRDGVMANPAWLRAQGLSGDQMFTTGKVAAYFVGEWRLRSFNVANPLLNWDMAMVPYQAQRAIELGGIGYILNPNAKHKREAWTLLQFLATSDEVQASVVSSGMGLSPLRRMPPLAFPGKRTDIMLASMNYLRKLDMFPQWSQIYDTIEAPNLSKVWSGQANVRSTLENIARQANAVLGW